MNRTEYPRLGEVTFQTVLPNGLTVMVVPRPGFSRKLAYFVTDYGAIHTDYRMEGKTYSAPAGVAHFLEHKMFDMPGERDISAEFAALGTGVNAFTSYDLTAYYISGTEHFEESLRLLLEFVSTPYFTPESVEKEMGIIDQEIGMNLDAPDSQVFENLATGLYREHPIRVPILGSHDSIREITPQILYDCHRAFYTPGNMLLCVVGDVDPHWVEEVAEAVLGKDPAPVGEKLLPRENSMDAVLAEQTCQMEVPFPTFQLGFKCEPTEMGDEAIRQEIVGDLAAEALFGESSQLYLRLYESGIIDSSFGGGFETVDNMAMLLCGGDSEDPQAVRQAILEEGARIAREGLEEADFIRMKRSALGRRIRDLDSFDSVCFRMCAYHFSGFDYFRFPELYEKVDRTEVQEFLDRVIRPERCSLSVIEPNDQEV